MRFIQFAFVVLSTAALTVGLSHTVIARPFPDRAGICYFFRREKHELTQTCVISGGYGAGGHYAVLLWPDGVKTNITKINYCPQRNSDKKGFCRYTVDNREAKPYQRDVFLNPTSIADTDNLDCYRVISSGNSVCYRFNR